MMSDAEYILNVKKLVEVNRRFEELMNRMNIEIDGDYMPCDNCRNKPVVVALFCLCRKMNEQT